MLVLLWVTVRPSDIWYIFFPPGNRRECERMFLNLWDF